MSEPIKKLNQTVPESYSPKKPEIVDMAKELQKEDITEAEKIFIRKNKVELVTLNEEIKVVGLSFQKCKQTGSVELNSPMDLYGDDKFEMLNSIKNKSCPEIGYCVWANGDGDMINGKGVTDFDAQDEIFAAYTIPAGEYVKLSWNAETFGELVMDAMEKAGERAGIDKFLKEHNLVADHTLDVEVYPQDTIGKEMKSITSYPEMYTLFTVKGNSTPESYSPKKPEIVDMVKETQQTEKFVQTINYKGVDFEIVERADVLWAGCVDYANNNTDESDIGATLKRYQETVKEIDIKNKINPDYSAALSINYGSKDKPCGIMFANETYSEEQDKRFDLLTQPSGLWMRIGVSKDTDDILFGRANYGLWEYFGELRNASKENGYIQNPDVYIEIEYNCHAGTGLSYAYIPVIKSPES